VHERQVEDSTAWMAGALSSASRNPHGGSKRAALKSTVLRLLPVVKKTSELSHWVTGITLAHPQPWHIPNRGW
jgi:hypothetical protein